MYEEVKKTFHCSNNHFKVCCSFWSLAILYLLHTYYNACSDLEEPEVPQYSLCVNLFLGLADRVDAFTMFNSAIFLFNAESRRKRLLYPEVTTAPKRQSQNTGIPESKALFPVL